MKILILLLLLIPFVLAEDLNLYTPCGGDNGLIISCFGDTEINPIKEPQDAFGEVEKEVGKGIPPIYTAIMIIAFFFLLFAISRRKNKKGKVY